MAFSLGSKLAVDIPEWAPELSLNAIYAQAVPSHIRSLPIPWKVRTICRIEVYQSLPSCLLSDINGRQTPINRAL